MTNTKHFQLRLSHPLSLPPSSLPPSFTTSFVPTPPFECALPAAHTSSFLCRQVGAQRCVGPHHCHASPVYSPPLHRPPHLRGHPLCVPPLITRTPFPCPYPFHANGDANRVVRTLLLLVHGPPPPPAPPPTRVRS